MKVQFPQMAQTDLEHSAETAERLQALITEQLPSLESEFVQDLSHISQFAGYGGNMTVDQVEYLKDNLYRCEYSYDWQISWTCAGTQESGRAKEKVRFTLTPDGEVTFKFLKFD